MLTNPFGVRGVKWIHKWINGGTRPIRGVTAKKPWTTFQLRVFVAKCWSPVFREELKFPEHSMELQLWTAALSISSKYTKTSRE